MRNSPTADLVDELTKLGLAVSVHDHFVKDHPLIPHSSELEETIEGADVVVIMVAHQLYRSLNPQILRNLMRGNLLIDARNIFDFEEFESSGFEIYSIGRGNTWE